MAGRALSSRCGSDGVIHSLTQRSSNIAKASQHLRLRHSLQFWTMCMTVVVTSSVKSVEIMKFWSGSTQQLEDQTGELLQISALR